MRGKKAPRREILPDPVYNSVLVSKLINLVMKDGKKHVANKIVYATLKRLEDGKEKSGLEILEEALEKVRPTVVLKARRVGGANFQVPLPVERDAGTQIALRWILEAARKRKGAPIVEDLVKEINDILTDQGDVLKKREDTHRMAESNRAFSHFR
ncbi:MAG: 30S ribosomal protein S7 [Candidatus Dojkabacteria bacterium]